MAIADTDDIDLQLFAENITFLDHCFENSFELQSSLQVVKENAINNDCNHNQSRKLCKRLSFHSQNTALRYDVTQPGPISNQIIIKHKIKDWGLPTEIAKKYEEKGITEMFDWQVSCLSNPKVLFECCNLVYSAPTSAGKTLVAEIITIKTVLEKRKKVLVILPFVSIVREKMFYFQDLFSSSGIRVEGFMGSQSPPGGLQAVHIAICTIEKANSLINKLLDEGSLSELGAIIVDELHLLGDPSRGYILELMLTKIKYVSCNLDDVKIQIVGMSATLPNLEVLASWLDAELFITKFRPIPLDEYCLVGNKFYNKLGNCVGNLDSTLTDEGDGVLNICLNTIRDGCSILIFCMTKNWCENLAQCVASAFYNLGCNESETGSILRSQLNSETIAEVLEQLKNCPVGLDQVLKKTISFGVAYHHAGLTFDERDIVEGGFKSGAIRVLVATSTLSSGVNLPARKVIIRSPLFQKQPINNLTYKQMIGRAGRMGKDLKGESILMCTEAEKKIGFELMMGTLDPVKSCIDSEDKYMRALLEMIASQEFTLKAELDLYSKCTLLYNQQETVASQKFLLENTIEELKNYELIRLQNKGEEKCYVATLLGKACLSSSMAPNDGLSLFCELQKARQCLVLETDLHLIYLVTPYSVSSQWRNMDWLHLLTLWESLSKAMKRVGELVGVQESFIIRSLRGNMKSNNLQNKINIHKRFYTALALQELVNEVPLTEVAEKFQCARGFLQSLQQGAATFAGMVTAFSRQLGWKNMEKLISQFQDRLHFGIHSELLELMKLSCLNGTRARTLYDSGFETITSIASADVNTIENILHKSVPFQSDKAREGDDNDDVRKRNKMKSVWITGYRGMTTKEAALNLIAEARKYLSLEIGVADIKWDNKLKQSSTILESSTNDIDNGNPNIKLNPRLENEKKLPNNIVPCDAISKEVCKNKQLLKSQKQDNNKNDLTIRRLNHIPQFKLPEKPVMETDNQVPNKTCTQNYSKTIDIDQKKISLTTSNISKKDHDVCLNSESCSYYKDDIIWDSMTFNDTDAIAMDNITKLRTSDKMFSPNISFREFEKSMTSENCSENIDPSKYMSTKDITLFSSEGDNSSLFEDSLPLDLIPSKLLDKEPTILCKQETALGYTNISSNTIIDAFKSNLLEAEDSEDEDIRLVYEEDNRTEGEHVGPRDFEIATHINNKTPSKRRNNFNDHLQPFEKRTKTEFQIVIPKSLTKCDAIPQNTLNTKCALSKIFTMELNEYKIICYVLRADDIIDNLKVIENEHIASIYLDFPMHNTNNEVIGSDVFDNHGINYKRREISPMKGIAIFLNNERCISIYLDFTSIDDMGIVKSRLVCWLQRKLTLKVMCSSAVNFSLTHWLGITLTNNVTDIALTEWLIDSTEKVPSLEYLAKKYCGIDFGNFILKIGSDQKTKKLKNLNVAEIFCLRVWCVWVIADKQERYISENLPSLHSILGIEHQVSKILSNCEHYGITVDKDLTSRLLIEVRNSQETLQKKAFKLCGYHFNFNSSKDVAKVLGIYNGRKVSTKKSVLTSHNTPLSSIVIYWRKLNAILTKTLYPLTEKACIYTEGNRINPSYTMFTSTGRISMHEPNLQNVPRTFHIPSEYLTLNSTKCDGTLEFNIRNVFKAASGYILVSADYCQLEMRILTHFCKDHVLLRIMRSNTDVFTSIAASWGNVPPDKVDDDLRQKAKQLCYGIIYGMGNNTLASLLDVTELEAACFMDAFYKTYPAVGVYTQRIKDKCKRYGYVETLTKRRRYLPDINSNIMAKKCAAERQAVNTTIQGSAADIAKAAMCSIDTKTECMIPKPRLILQMHDELIYEVPQYYKQSFITIIKKIMEETVKLTVPLPVKVKCGLSWGDMKEVVV